MCAKMVFTTRSLCHCEAYTSYVCCPGKFVHVHADLHSIGWGLCRSRPRHQSSCHAQKMVHLSLHDPVVLPGCAAH